MAAEPAPEAPSRAFARWPRLPARIPQFGTRSYWLFTALWAAALLLALIGPIAGTYQRLSGEGQNSQLLLGSRAGMALAEEDVTRIRFPVGPEARALGIGAGDDIVAVDTMPVSAVVDFSQAAVDAGRLSDGDYAAFADILTGTEPTDHLIRLRAPDGREREIIVSTGEQHIEQAAAEYGIPAWALRIVDLVHLLTYPFLIAAAWILHRRNARDTVSSIVSLAILLTIAAENPSAAFLMDTAGLPQRAHAFLYDLGNICLLAGILLFPHGRFEPRPVLLLLPALPALMLLQGDLYRTVFMLFMLGGVAVLVRRLRDLDPGPQRQQIKWALFGFSGYAIFLAISLISDMLKTGVEAFWLQLLIEGLAGLALGLAFLSLQAGLLVALLRYRLYDAEVVISRSASFAIVTITLAAAFAGVMEAIIESMQEAFGDRVGTGAAVLGAALATVLIHPLHEKVQQWAERRFHKNLLHLREGLPQAVRDLREVDDLPEFLKEVLARVQNGVRTVRSAFVLDGAVSATSGVSHEEAARWLSGFAPGEMSGDEVEVECAPEDAMFPVRVPLACANSSLRIGWLLVGPRPDGSIPGDDEREALAAVAPPIAGATRIVVKRQAQEREVAEALEAQTRRIAALEARLASPPAAAAGR